MRSRHHHRRSHHHYAHHAKETSATEVEKAIPTSSIPTSSIHTNVTSVKVMPLTEGKDEFMIHGMHIFKRSYKISHNAGVLDALPSFPAWSKIGFLVEKWF